MAKKAKTSTKVTNDTKKEKAASGQAFVYIIGDSPLVEDYARLCAQHGYAVVAQWNETPKQEQSFDTGAIKVGGSIPRGTSVGIELTVGNKEHKRKNLVTLDKALPPTAPVLSSSITVTATEQSTWLTGKHRLVGIGALPAMTQYDVVEVAPTVHTPKETVDVVLRFFRSLGKEIEVVQDRVGMVLPRILCQLVNEAAFLIQEDVALPQDIDTAMRLGTNYPFGPLEWGSKIGFQNVHSVLSALENDLHEDRYRISPLLTMLAQTGEWWKKD